MTDERNMEEKNHFKQQVMLQIIAPLIFVTIAISILGIALFQGIQFGIFEIVIIRDISSILLLLLILPACCLSIMFLSLFIFLNHRILLWLRLNSKQILSIPSMINNILLKLSEVITRPMIQIESITSISKKIQKKEPKKNV
jgi:hypothetical protein